MKNDATGRYYKLKKIKKFSLIQIMFNTHETLKISLNKDFTEHTKKKQVTEWEKFNMFL